MPSGSGLRRAAPAWLAALIVAAALAAAPAGINVANMDTHVLPGNDFFRYANGGWVARTPIPGDRAAVDVFTELEQLANQRTAALIRDIAASHPAPGSEAAQIADLDHAYMDTGAIDGRGMAPLQPWLAQVAAIANRTELAQALGHGLRADEDALNDTNFHSPNLFGLWVAAGFHDPAHFAPYLLQGGIELPDRSYYLSDSASMRTLRAQYVHHVAAMLALEHLDHPQQRAEAVTGLETSIARVHWTLTADQDVHKADNRWRAADFAQRAPGLDWKAFFQAAGLGGVSEFYVWQPSAFTGEARLVASTPLDTWKDWLDYHLIEHYALVLPKAVRDERFAFWGRDLDGLQAPQPRWELAMAVENDVLGDAIGQRYAAKYFPASAKTQAQQLVAHLVAVYQRRLQALSWMAPSTKREAEAKLAALYVGVGYPDHWRSYRGLTLKPDDAFGNEQRAGFYDVHYQIARIGQPVDRHQWHMEPQTVNALNLPLLNALNFPAAILQPPFFDPQAPVAVNYGAIGAVIGHEISHTFDTEGSLFDAHGELRNWWTPADFAHFHAATQALAAQVSSYRPFPDLAVNGEQTLAEDIADLAGLGDAYQAYHDALGGRPGPSQQGFTADQQFFIAFGQDWAAKMRPAALRNEILTDPHAPAQYRAATVRNLDAWYRAFDVKPGQKLYLAPGERVRIW